MIRITFVGRPVPGQIVTVTQNGKSVTVRHPAGEAVATPAIVPSTAPALLINDAENARLLLAAAVGSPDVDVAIHNPPTTEAAEPVAAVEAEEAPEAHDDDGQPKVADAGIQATAEEAAEPVVDEEAEAEAEADVHEQAAAEGSEHGTGVIQKVKNAVGKVHRKRTKKAEIKKDEDPGF